MSHPTGPHDHLHDPFAPEVVRVPLGDGRYGIDLGATAMNHIEAPLPQINSSSMQKGDVLTVEFDDNRIETFNIESIQADSLVFGSEGVMDREIVMRRPAEGGNEQPSVKLYGSAVFPSGGFRTPGTIRADSYMVTDEGVTRGAIRTFDLRRPDENGELQPVRLNKTEVQAESKSFSHAKQTFETLSGLLENDGFTFEQQDEHGMSKRYQKVNQNLLVYAARQGFGHGVTPQDEVYVYDAEAQVLRAIRNIPTEGVIQTMVAEGVTKDIFQEAFIGYNGQQEPDWRYPRVLSSSGIHALSKFTPIVSHTWLSPEQDAPIATVLEDGEQVSDLFRTPKRAGVAFAETMKADGEEHLIDSISQSLGIDPRGGEYLYTLLEVDIYPGQKPNPRVGRADLWPSQEAAAAFVDRVKTAIALTYRKDHADLTVDGHTIRIRTDVDRQVDKMVEAARLALGASQQAIGSRLLRHLRVRPNGSNR